MNEKPLPAQKLKLNENKFSVWKNKAVKNKKEKIGEEEEKN